MKFLTLVTALLAGQLALANNAESVLNMILTDRTKNVEAVGAEFFCSLKTSRPLSMSDLPQVEWDANTLKLIGCAGSNDVQVVQSLIAIAKNPKYYYDVRSAAFSAADKVAPNDPAVLRDLVSVLTDEKSQCGKTFYRGNSSMPFCDAVQYLILDGKKKQVSAEILASIEAAAINESQSDEVRKTSLYILSEVKYSTPALVQAAEKIIASKAAVLDNMVFRAYAVKTIQNAKTPSTGQVALLIQTMKKDEDSSIQWDATEALGDVQPATAKIVAALLDVAAERDGSYEWHLREHAIKALQKTRTSDVKVAEALMKTIVNEKEGYYDIHSQELVVEPAARALKDLFPKNKAVSDFLAKQNLNYLFEPKADRFR